MPNRPATPARKIDPLAEAIADVEGMPEPATASDIGPAVNTEEFAAVALPGTVGNATSRLTSQRVWAEVGKVIAHPAGSLDLRTVSKKLLSLLPKDRRAATVLELVPEGTFLTYGIGVSHKAMMDPVAARAHVPTAER